MVKILAALIQLLYASATMYQSRGDQVDWYGYSTFGLTVAPYAWMSFVNLCANLMCPDYPSMYLVGSKEMTTLSHDLKREHEQRFDGVVGSEAMTKLPHDLKGEHEQRFDGVVGTLTDDSYNRCVESVRKRRSRWERTEILFRSILFTGLAASVPIAIIGSISRFQSGSHSTATQQISVSIWLLYGVYFGVMSPLLQRAFEERPIVNTRATSTGSKIAQIFVVLIFLLGFNAVLGFIHVGQMIMAYGVCIQVS